VVCGRKRAETEPCNACESPITKVKDEGDSCYDAF
jgi:hypothetical protein